MKSILKNNWKLIVLLLIYVVLVVIAFSNNTLLDDKSFFDNYVKITFYSSLMLVMVLFLYHYHNKVFHWVKNNRNLVVYFLILIVLGALVRIFFVRLSAERWIFSQFFVMISRGSSNLYPRMAGWPLLVHLFFFFVKDTILNMALLNTIIGSFTPIFFYFLIFNITKNRLQSIIASFLLAVSPLYMIITSTDSYTAPAVAFTIFCFTFLFRYINNKNLKDFSLSLFLLYLAITMRPEYIFLLPIYFAAFLIYSSNGNDERMLYIWCVFLILILPYILGILIYYSNLGQDFYLHGRLMDESHLIKSLFQNYGRLFLENFVPNIKILFSNQHILVFNVMLAFVGFLNIIKKKKKEWIFFLGFFLTFFIAYAAMHKEGFFDSTRKYIPSLLIPILFFSSAAISNFIKDFKRKEYRTIVMIVFIVLFSFASYINLSDYKAERSKHSDYKEFLVLSSLDFEINTRCDVIINSYSSIFPYLFDFKGNPHSIINSSELDRLDKTFDSAECTYFYSGYFNKFTDETEKITRVYDFELIKKKLYEQEFSLLLSEEIDGVEIFLFIHENP